MSDNLGDRIKRYEHVSRQSLIPNSYIILRVDGKAFHTFTKGMDRPFDDKLTKAMIRAGEKVSKEMSGFKLGYHQSDEFTFMLTDTDSYDTQVWFDGEIQKLCSVTASLFGAHFNKEMGGTICAFDCRAFNVPKEDVANVFIWRQKDWERNSLNMLASSFFSHKELQGKSCEQRHDMLHSIGENWADLPDVYKNGTFISMHGRMSKKMDYDGLNEFISTLKRK